MIQQDLIDQLDPNTAKMVKAAVLTIVNSGIIELQQERNLATLTLGTQDESDIELGEKIRSFRRQNVRLLEFKQLGESIKQDNES